LNKNIHNRCFLFLKPSSWQKTFVPPKKVEEQGQFTIKLNAMNKNTKNSVAPKIACFFAVFLLMCAGLNAQGRRVSFGMGVPGSPYFNDGSYVTGAHVLPDSNYLLVVNNPESVASYFFAWFGSQGSHQYGGNIYFQSEDEQFHHFSRASLLLPDHALVVLEEKLPATAGARSIFLSHFADTTGTGTPDPKFAYPLSWHKQVFAEAGKNAFANDLAQTLDDGLVVLGSVEEALSGAWTDVLLAKTTANGWPVWTKVFPTSDNDYGVSVVAAADGGYFILKAVQPQADTSRREAHLMKTDGDGNLLWQTNLSGAALDRPLDMTANSDGNLVVSGNNVTAGNDAFLMKVGLDGTVLWRQDFEMSGRLLEGRRVLEDANGDLVVAGRLLDSTSMENDILLLKTSSSGAPLWERNVGRASSQDQVYDLKNTPDGGYLLGGSTNPNTWPLALFIKTDVNGIIKAGLISGNVFNDADSDCDASAGDLPLENWIVEAFQDSSKIFYGSTDSLGNYRIECDTGDYVVNVIRPVDYWQSCVNDVAVHVGYLDTVQLDFPVHGTIECPYLTVNHASTVVRPCDTTTFTVSFCNVGSETADDAYTEVLLDDLFTFLESDIPPSSQNGNLLTFPLGDLASGECGSFQFTVSVDCAAELGMAACSEVHIYPDSLCLPPDSTWSGAFIQASSVCTGDSVRFALTNTGTQPMPAALEYIVIEDAVLLMQGDFQLNESETMEIPVLASGATYHLIAQQEPGAPGSSRPLAAMEGCTGSSGGASSTSFYNQFPQNDGEPFLSVFCVLVQNAYDPNDKQAFPTGFDDEHFIEANTDLEYLIRFQNTGNDTAFRVILLDTLSPFLNPATVKPGASSHPYLFEIEENGVLRFNFPNIELPDSNTNLAASQGFVSFRIAQRSGNPVGTVIENRAGIYFNFNPPVMTNTVFHTVHEPFFKVVSAAPHLPGVKLQIGAYPNPFSEQLQIEVSGKDVTEGMFRLYNANGQLLRTLPLLQNRATLQRGRLEAGIYFFTLHDDTQLLGSGKVIVK
jgi:hypothetical protein